MTIFHRSRWIHILALTVSCLLGSGLAAAEESIVFPADAGVIDLTQAPYNAVGDGTTDCTDAIQRALDDYAAKNRILYLPNGTYLIRHTLEWGPSRRLNPDKEFKGEWGSVWRLTILQGESESKTVIKLADKAADFQNAAWNEKDSRPGGRPLIFTGGWPAQRFRNAVRNLTLDTGKDNPGAIGIQFNASNSGTMHRVTVRSGDGQGTVGLDLGYCGDHGPGAGRHLTITGFDYGIWAGSMNSMTLWDVRLSNQRKAGIRVWSEELWLSDIVSVNTVPALEVGDRWSSWATVINGSFTGGAADTPAIRIIGNPKERHVFCRDLKIAGYGTSVAVEKDASKNVAMGDLTEWSLHGGQTLFPADTVRTLRLPVKSPPEISLPKLGKDWANVVTFGAIGDNKADDTAAFQAALNSGASTIYMPGGKIYNVSELTIPATCERIIGCEAYLNGDRFLITEGTRPIIFERWHPFWNNGRNIDLDIQAPRTVIVREIAGMKVHQRSSGDLFIEDCVAQLFLHGKGTKAWCRFFNYEPNKELAILNDGGDLWIHGGKTEHAGGKMRLINGSRTEFFGSFWYASFGRPEAEPGCEIIDSSAVFAVHRQHSFGKGKWDPFIKVTQNGETKVWNNWAVDLLCIGTPAQ